jgi:hypothetical protein
VLRAFPFVCLFVCLSFREPVSETGTWLAALPFPRCTVRRLSCLQPHADCTPLLHRTGVSTQWGGSHVRSRRQAMLTVRSWLRDSIAQGNCRSVTKHHHQTYSLGQVYGCLDEGSTVFRNDSKVTPQCTASQSTRRYSS